MSIIKLACFQAIQWGKEVSLEIAACGCVYVLLFNFNENVRTRGMVIVAELK